MFMMGHADQTTYTARWVFPADRPPLAGGVVTVQGSRIAAVTGRDDGPPADVALGNVALLPGFVNAHTHLDLSGLRGACPPTPDFVGWLRQVTQHRLATSADEVQRNIAAGIAECLRFGTTLVGDIASLGASASLLSQSPLRTVVFYELLGLSAERSEQAGMLGDAWLRSMQEGGDTWRSGLSPHAPYSVRHDLFRHVAARHVPVAVHLAESPEELELLRSHAGPFVEFLNDRGVWDPAGLVGDVAEVVQCYRDQPAALFIHGNFWPPDLALGPNQSVVYCPRTHAAFGHAPHPFRAMLRRGVRVALGTDSLASNPDLDILAEARFLAAQHPDLDGATLLRMLTLDGAAALGWGDVTGSLTPGKSADLVVLPLPDRDEPDPHRLVFDSDAAVQAVMFRGRWIESARPAP